MVSGTLLSSWHFCETQECWRARTPAHAGSGESASPAVLVCVQPPNRSDRQNRQAGLCKPRLMLFATRPRENDSLKIQSLQLFNAALRSVRFLLGAARNGCGGPQPCALARIQSSTTG